MIKKNRYVTNMSALIKTVNLPKRFNLSSPSKISIKSNCAFSLPAGKDFSCAGETDACKKDCYAKKFRHTWANVQTPMAENWKLLKKLEKEGDAKKSGEMLSKIIPKSAKIFRIFESGDFNSQWAIEMWAEAVKSKPEVMFWAYTRNFDLNFTPLTKLPNFNLWASTDRCNIAAAKKFVKRFKKSGTKHAYGPWGRKDPIPSNSFVCGVTSGKMKLIGACERCMICVLKKSTKKNVVFLSH